MYPQAQDAFYLKNVKNCVPSLKLCQILQPRDQVIQTLLQAACGKSICMNGHDETFMK